MYRDKADRDEGRSGRMIGSPEETSLQILLFLFHVVESQRCESMWVYVIYVCIYVCTVYCYVLHTYGVPDPGPHPETNIVIVESKVRSPKTPRPFQLEGICN